MVIQHEITIQPKSWRAVRRDGELIGALWREATGKTWWGNYRFLEGRGFATEAEAESWINECEDAAPDDDRELAEGEVVWVKVTVERTFGHRFYAAESVFHMEETFPVETHDVVAKVAAGGAS